MKNNNLKIAKGYKALAIALLMCVTEVHGQTGLSDVSEQPLTQTEIQKVEKFNKNNKNQKMYFNTVLACGQKGVLIKDNETGEERVIVPWKIKDDNYFRIGDLRTTTGMTGQCIAVRRIKDCLYPGDIVVIKIDISALKTQQTFARNVEEYYDYTNILPMDRGIIILPRNRDVCFERERIAKQQIVARNSKFESLKQQIMDDNQQQTR